MSKIKIISYNLHINKAVGDLEALVQAHKPDVLCLQECDTTTPPSHIRGMTLAASTAPTDNKDGLLTYINPKRLELLLAEPVKLQRSAHAAIHAIDRERLLTTHYKDKETGQDIYIGNIHATHLVATNLHRRREINKSIKHLKQLSNGQPTVIIGDFNYPFFPSSLIRVARRNGLSLLRSSSPTYQLKKFKAHFDMALQHNVLDAKLKTLPFMVSDHAPIELNVTY